jgi:hypothetical protein
VGGGKERKGWWKSRHSCLFGESVLFKTYTTQTQNKQQKTRFVTVEPRKCLGDDAIDCIYPFPQRLWNPMEKKENGGRSLDE